MASCFCVSVSFVLFSKFVKWSQSQSFLAMWWRRPMRYLPQEVTVWRVSPVPEQYHPTRHLPQEVSLWWVSPVPEQYHPTRYLPQEVTLWWVSPVPEQYHPTRHLPQEVTLWWVSPVLERYRPTRQPPWWQRWRRRGSPTTATGPVSAGRPPRCSCHTGGCTAATGAGDRRHVMITWH